MQESGGVVTASEANSALVQTAKRFTQKSRRLINWKLYTCLAIVKKKKMFVKHCS